MYLTLLYLQRRDGWYRGEGIPKTKKHDMLKQLHGNNKWV
jgi:hypothetical protein